MTQKEIITRAQAIEAIAQGRDLAELRNINEATIDFIYAFSTLHYDKGNYDDAIIGFRFLCKHKHRDADMWLALARSLFTKGEQVEALKAYLMTAFLRPTAALCLEIARIFFIRGEKEQAQVFISAARRALLPNNPPQLEADILAVEKEVGTL